MESKERKNSKNVDKRFDIMNKDPRFRSIPKHNRKVKIDKRFQKMFTDDHFKLKYAVDKRGKAVNKSSNDHLKKYYDLSDSDSESESDTESNSIPEKSVKNADISKNKSRKEEHSEDISVKKSYAEDSHSSGKDAENKKNGTSAKKSSILTLNKEASEDDSDTESESESESDESSEDESKSDIDLARGEGNVETSSDDSSSEEDEFVHPWGEMDSKVPETMEITYRLAVCNMDWDRINAQDVLKILNSFKPAAGTIKSVKIYPSEFGLERMKYEEANGPKELTENCVQSDDEEALDNVEGSKYHMEKLRQYQLNRLKYYYAVVECDTSETANKIYEECDGYELESSASKIDLRFIPDDMTFEQEPKSEAVSLEEIKVYKPKYFTTTALKQARVDLTWDECNPERKQVIENAFNSKDASDLQTYLASSSDEEETDVIKLSDDKDSEDEESQIMKYKSLIQSIDEEKQKKIHNDVQMEITWGPGLKSKTEELVKKKQKNSEISTPWDQFLEKKKEKKKEKRKQKQSEKNESDNPYSDDDLPDDVDFNDPFFKQLKDTNKTERKNKIKSKQETPSEVSDKAAELELILMDENDDNKHFNMNKINERSNKKLKKKRHSESDQGNEDNFKINVKDPRFQAVYHSQEYNIDPTNSQFRRTMDVIIDEKQKRFNSSSKSIEKNSFSNENPTKEFNSKSGLNMLVKSVKNKVQSIHNKKARLK